LQAKVASLKSLLERLDDGEGSLQEAVKENERKLREMESQVRANGEIMAHFAKEKEELAREMDEEEEKNCVQCEIL